VVTRRPIEVVWDALEARDRRPRGPEHQFTALCPAHDDHEPSLSVGEGKDGKAVVTCHAGCRREDVLAELGLGWKDLFPNGDEPADRRLPPKRRPVSPNEADAQRFAQRLLATPAQVRRLQALRGWSAEAIENLGIGLDETGRVTLPVRNGEGRLVDILRYQPDPEQRGDGNVKMRANGPRQLFPAPETITGDELWIVEGEPDALTLATLGLPGVALPGPKLSADWWPRLAKDRKRIVLVPDCDDAGRSVAAAVEPELVDLVDEAVTVELSDLAADRKGFDAGDLLIARLRDGDTVEQIAALLRERAYLSAQSSDSNSTGDADSTAEWCMAADAFIDIERPPLDPYVSTPNGKTVMLAREETILVAGPSDVGKSLVALDLGGRLAAESSSSWLALEVRGGLRVLLLGLEGSDDETAKRLRLLIPDTARKRFIVADRWRGGPLPRPSRDEQAHELAMTQLARTIAEKQIDVVIIDTASKFFDGRYDCGRGVPEAAGECLEDLRRRSGRPVAFVIVLHTKKAPRDGKMVDQLEEIAGDFYKYPESAIVVRCESEREGPRRKVVFAKTRRGPKPKQVIAAFPDEDSTEPPRLTVVSITGSRVKEGNEAERIAEWIAEQEKPSAVSVIIAALSITASTLARRRDELEALGIRYGPVPSRGNSRAYGTGEQWNRAYGLVPDLDAEPAS